MAGLQQASRRAGGPSPEQHDRHLLSAFCVRGAMSALACLFPLAAQPHEVTAAVIRLLQTGGQVQRQSVICAGAARSPAAPLWGTPTLTPTAREGSMGSGPGQRDGQGRRKGASREGGETPGSQSSLEVGGTSRVRGQRSSTRLDRLDAASAPRGPRSVWEGGAQGLVVASPFLQV